MRLPAYTTCTILSHSLDGGGGGLAVVGVQDALLSRPPGEDEAQSPLSETPPDLHSLSEPEGSLRLLFVQDVVEPVTRAAQAVAQARCGLIC